MSKNLIFKVYFTFIFSYKNNKRFAEGANRTITSDEINNLAFVSVRDGDGRPIRDASSVQVWNTHKQSVKTFPVGSKTF